MSSLEGKIAEVEAAASSDINANESGGGTGQEAKEPVVAGGSTGGEEASGNGGGLEAAEAEHKPASPQSSGEA